MDWRAPPPASKFRLLAGHILPFAAQLHFLLRHLLLPVQPDALRNFQSQPASLLPTPSAQFVAPASVRAGPSNSDIPARALRPQCAAPPTARLPLPPPAKLSRAGPETSPFLRERTRSFLRDDPFVPAAAESERRPRQSVARGWQAPIGSTRVP